MLCCKEGRRRRTGHGNRVRTGIRRGAVAAPHAAKSAMPQGRTRILATEQVRWLSGTSELAPPLRSQPALVLRSRGVLPKTRRRDARATSAGAGRLRSIGTASAVWQQRPLDGANCSSSRIAFEKPCHSPERGVQAAVSVRSDRIAPASPVLPSQKTPPRTPVSAAADDCPPRKARW